MTKKKSRPLPQFGKSGRSKKSNFDPESVGDYAVGYGLPPEHTRFPNGKSGNPAGRPIGSKNKHQDDYRAIVNRVFSRTIDGIENGVPRKMSLIEAVLLKTVSLAMNGNQRAARDLLNIAKATSDSFQAERLNLYYWAVEYCDKYEKEKSRRARRFEGPQKSFLHPDNFVFDHDTQTVTIVRLSNAEIETGLNVAKVLEWMQYDVYAMRQDLKSETDPSIRLIIHEAIVEQLDLIIKLQNCLGFPWATEQPDHEMNDSFLDTIKRKKPS